MIATCPYCGSQLAVIDPEWSDTHKLARCEGCGAEIAIQITLEYDWQKRKDLA